MGNPKYVKYLLDPQANYDSYVVVGNSSIAPVEKIGVVPKMLYAHSAVMRTDLQVKNIEDKVPFEITDILPSTFKNLLRFVYGHDTSSTLCFDDADNLLYAAEKYMISDLKDNLAERLMSLLNCENICILMNNPACYQALELNSLINEILRYETREVLASPYFSELTSDAFVKILEQEILKVEEIEIWRNALFWAKNKANSEAGDKLRKELVKPLKHIRLCTLTKDEFCEEVVPTKVLSSDEVVEVCICLGKKGQKQPELLEICDNVEKRKQHIECSFSLSLDDDCYSSDPVTWGRFALSTKEFEVELSTLTLTTCVKGKNQVCDFTVTVDHGSGTVATVIYSESDADNMFVEIPMSTEDQKVLLLPNEMYWITIKTNVKFFMYQVRNLCQNDHLSMQYDDDEDEFFFSSMQSTTKYEAST